MMRLPIDTVPNTDPPKFRWNQVVGGQVVAHEDTLEPRLERAVERLVTVAKALLMENAALQGQVKFLTDEREKADSAEQPAAKPASSPAGNRKGQR